MKIKFSREITFTPTWRDNDKLPENERIVAKLTVMNVQDFIEAVEFIASAKGIGVVSEANIVQTKGLLEAARNFLPKYVKLSNFVDDENKEITVDMVVTNATLLNLTAELFMKLVEVSQPSDADLKN